ncbi:MAG: hypothetical protein NTZ78_10245 [Candidatus Aureabacteria bacterium]|nr:hypothetical protein [Candidatus Auribacterota bacterium]
MIIIDYNYSPLHIQVLKKNERRDYHSFNDDYFTYDPYLFWRPRSGFSIFNSQGFRGKELPTVKGDEYRIFAFGDSNTLGWRGKNGPNWPLYLEV